MEDTAATYPNDWTLQEVQSLAERMRAGGTPSRAVKEYWGGDIPFALIEDITASGFYLEQASERLTQEGLESSSAWIVPPGAVLLSMYATIGATVVNRIPVATNQAILAIQPKKGYSAEFIALSLRAHKDALARLNVESTQKNISKGIVSTFKLPVPPLPEQQRIARVLSTVQEAIAQQERLIRTTTELKQALMQKLFTEGLRGEALKETEIGRVPESWEVVPLGSLVDFSQGKQVPLEDQQLLPEPGLTRFLRIVDYTQRTTDWRFVKVDSDKYTVRPEDIIMVRYGAVFVGTGLAGVLANNMFKIEPKSKILDKSFLYYLLSRETIVAHLQSSMMGAGMPALNFGMLRGIMVPLPRTEEQIDLAISLKRFDQKITLIDRKKSSLQDLFRTLLHELMTGKVRVGEMAHAETTAP